uniref:RRM domain-containing protein n=1 Tax=Kalanchoe fedtschenkoi TaxID=63787 RepID=A0A7N0RA72_KALFE
MASNHAGNTISNGSLEEFMSAKIQSMKRVDPSEPFTARDKKEDATLERHIKEAERAAPHPFALQNQDEPIRGRFDPQIPSSYAMEGDRDNISARHYENSLFSSSLSDLFSRKMRLSSNNDIYGHSIDAAAPQYEEEESHESLKEIEAQTIGNLLPDDDDLLAGVTEGLDMNVMPGSGDDIEDMDLFSNIGGMDLGDDISSAEQKRAEYFGKNVFGLNGSSAGEHLYGELPSRTLCARNISSNVEDSELQSLFELYGDIHTLYTTRKHHGFVMVTYYDLRSACTAMKELQNKSLKHRKLDLHFSLCKDNLMESDINQGVIAFNLEFPVSNDELRRIFGIYGEIREIRETAQPVTRKFIEFYDVRAAEAALSELNRFDGAVKQIKVDLSRPGGAQRCITQNFSTELEHDDYMKMINPLMNSAGRTGLVPHGTIGSLTNGNNMGVHTSNRASLNPFVESSYHNGVSNSVPKSLPSLIRNESFGMQQAPPGLSRSPAQIKFEYQGVRGLHPHSLPDNHDAFPFNNPGPMATSVPGSAGRILNRQLSGLASNRNQMEMNVIGNGNRLHLGNHYSWNNSPNPHHSSLMWPNPNSPSFANGFHPQQRLHGIPRAPTHLPNPIMPVPSHHVGSAPAVNPSLWEMQHAFSAESVESSAFLPVSLGNLRMSNSSLQSMEFVPHNVFPHGGGSYHDSSVPSKGMGLHSHHQRCVMFPSRSQMGTMMNSFDSPNESIRGRRNDSMSTQTDNKKQYELDIDRILRGEDSRTTLMIKNIPNKYTSKMLLAAIDERHKGTYDFIYLPIDFKNKCNVGYAFINMTEPSLIVPFYQAFNGKKWEKFNSEKVASLAYARIQGKAALVAHFQNSSLMNEDKRCRPILFHTDGPNAGDQVPFPMGVSIRPRMGKTRTSITNEDQGSPPSLAIGEGFCGSDSSSGSVRDSD